VTWTHVSPVKSLPFRLDPGGIGLETLDCLVEAADPGGKKHAGINHAGSLEVQACFPGLPVSTRALVDRGQLL